MHKHYIPEGAEVPNMARTNRKIAVIGGGIAGLCTAVYARRCGYEVELLEKNAGFGGLATSWRRSDYTFETCLHWLLGSNPNSPMYAEWQQVFDIGKLKFVYPEEFVRLENERGEILSVYSNVDLMENEFLKRAPEDADEIHRFTSAIRKFRNFEIPDPSESWPRNWLTLLRTLPYLTSLRRWSNITSEEYSRRFTHPLLKSFFAGGASSAHLSAIALVFTLAWQSQRNAGYPIGGSQAVIQLIVNNLSRLGGHLHPAASVERILVEREAAVGVQLTTGEEIEADWVISAADGYSTIHRLLGGKYRNRATDRIYSTLETFCSYLQVSFGVAKDLSLQPGFLTRLLETPLKVDPDTLLRQVSFRIFHYDPTFAPAGKTAVTCFLPTRNFSYWVQLQLHNPKRYQAEKDRIAEAVASILEKSVPDIRDAVEVIDVSTPATVVRYTGNWKGSMEGWLLTPHTGFRPLPQTLPGLKQFLMVGQWVMPGGGLPSGLMTARSAMRAICTHDEVPFV